MDHRVQRRRRRQPVGPPCGASMSPPVITWFFNPALTLWPSPHDDVETTYSDRRNDRSDLDRRFCDRRLACEAESALLLRTRTLQHRLPRDRFWSALRMTSIKLVTGTVAVGHEQSLSPFGLGCRLWLAMCTPVRRPGCLYVGYCSIERSFGHNPVRRGDVSGRLGRGEASRPSALSCYYDTCVGVMSSLI